MYISVHAVPGFASQPCRQICRPQAHLYRGPLGFDINAMLYSMSIWCSTDADGLHKHVELEATYTRPRAAHLPQQNNIYPCLLYPYARVHVFVCVISRLWC